MKWQHLQPKVKQDTGASWEPRQRKCGETEIPTKLKEKEIYHKWLTYSSVFFSPDISSDRAILAWTFAEKSKQSPLPRYTRQQEDSHQNHDGKQITLCYNIFCQWYETGNQIHTPRTAEDEEQLDLEPEQLSLITQKNSKQNFRAGCIVQNGGQWTNLHSK